MNASNAEFDEFFSEINRLIEIQEKQRQEFVEEEKRLHLANEELAQASKQCEVAMRERDHLETKYCLVREHVHNNRAKLELNRFKLKKMWQENKQMEEMCKRKKEQVEKQRRIFDAEVEQLNAYQTHAIEHFKETDRRWKNIVAKETHLAKEIEETNSKIQHMQKQLEEIDVKEMKSQCEALRCKIEENNRAFANEQVRD